MKSRRRIGHPKAWDYADSESALQQDFVARRIGFRWPLCAAANLEGGLLLRVIRVDFAISATGPLTLGKRLSEPRVTVWFDLCEATDIQPIRLDLKGCAAAV